VGRCRRETHFCFRECQIEVEYPDAGSRLKRPRQEQETESHNTTGVVMKLSIVIPAYNEERFIGAVVEKVKSVQLQQGIAKEIVIVNDGSTDNTASIIDTYKFHPEIKILHSSRNMGKTSAVRLGIELSRGDVIVIQDADLELSPDDYPSLIEPILQNRTHVVYGSRFMGTVKNMPVINRIANKVSNVTANLLFNARLSDINTCYKMFRRSVLENIEITSEHFTFDTEITAKLLRQGHRILEIPIGYFGRSRQEGKKMMWFRVLQVYWGIFKYRFA